MFPKKQYFIGFEQFSAAFLYSVILYVVNTEPNLLPILDLSIARTSYRIIRPIPPAHMINLSYRQSHWNPRSFL